MQCCGQLFLFIVAFMVVAYRMGTSDGSAWDCRYEETCDRCLAASVECAWCTDKLYTMRHRCATSEQLSALGCDENEIYENEPKTDTLHNDPVRDYELKDGRSVQVQPQRVYMKLVKGIPQQIKLTYRPARNNPLDLYVLMDLTWTMRDDKQTLVQLGTKLAEALHSLTANYRLGFGSFADKPTMPMIMPHLRENPCAPEHEVCEPTYGYRHQLSLTEDVAAFVRSVNDSRITGNLDNLEGGLDALMQVLVCPSQIGWKQEARKIVILVTDGFMHFAGDGLLAGIIQRNDKRCHLSAAGEYLGSLEYDYPSLEEIYRELLRRKINVIFAVTKDVVDTYFEMSGLMREISNVEILSTDSSNLLELIRKSYQSFIERTQFTDNSPSFISVDYETDCGGQLSTRRTRNYCNNVQMGKEVDFYINVTLTEYPSNGVITHKIHVEESSLNEYMEIEVELQKPCPCDEPDDPNNLDGRTQCEDHGFLQCGMCKCDEGWTGLFCSCATDSTNATTNDAIELMCRESFESSPQRGPVCSNRGECDCGSCICSEGYTGRYCECPDCDVDCDPDRAICSCGRCVCKYGWSGNSCNCKQSLDGCLGPTGEICSERGFCECGACVCEEPYVGNFCEIGTGTENKLCSFYEPCVTCLIEQKLGKGMCDNITETCSSAQERERFTYAFVSDEIDANVRCLARIEDKFGNKCDHYFTYQSLGQSENYLLIKITDCEPVNYVALVGLGSLITFLLGLLLIFLIWLAVREKDKREYIRFEQQVKDIGLNSNLNCIYKDPIRMYEVPKALRENSAENPFR